MALDGRGSPEPLWQAVRVIETERLRLRAPEADDAAGVFEMVSDVDIRRWSPVSRVTDLASAAAWCAEVADWSAGDRATWSVVEKDTGKFVGSVSVHSIDRVQADAEIGYRITPAARGRHIAVEAVNAVTAWAFDNLSLVRMELAHAVANPASCAVARHSGYRLEGLLRQSFVYGDGHRYDEHLHARLVTDRP